MAGKTQIQPEWSWRTQAEMSEAKAEGDDDYERQRTKEEEEEKDSDGYEDNRFSTVKKRFVEPSRNSGILFEFRQSRPFSVKSNVLVLQSLWVISLTIPVFFN